MDTDGQRSVSILCWNIEKRDLVGWALDKTKADVALFQEYNAAYPVSSQHAAEYSKFEAISFETFGTSIFSRGATMIATQSVPSPHGDFRMQFWKGKIHKCTALATLENGLTVVSFHGFNGTLQCRRPSMLVDHVQAVLAAIPPTGPCVFAGDFNTFTDEHHAAVDATMRAKGFEKSIQVRYNARQTLDLVYTRQCRAQLVESGHHKSDHPYMWFHVSF